MTEIKKRLITNEVDGHESVQNLVVKMEVAPLQDNHTMVRFYYHDSPDAKANKEEPMVAAFALPEEAANVLSSMLSQTLATREANRAIDRANRRPN